MLDSLRLLLWKEAVAAEKEYISSENHIRLGAVWWEWEWEGEKNDRNSTKITMDVVGDNK